MVLASSASAAYLIGGKMVHRFFRLSVNLECFLEWGTVDCSLINSADVLIIDECSMISAGLLKTVHKQCCFTTKDAGKNKLLFAGKSVFLEMFQLPSVENPQVFQSPLWKHFQMVSLKTVGSLKIGICRTPESNLYWQP